MSSALAETILLGFAARATYLVPVVIAALLVGEPLARLLRLPALQQWIGTQIAALDRKLNRPTRSVATRLYRGIAALAMLLIPALALGIALIQPAEWVVLLRTLLLVALFGIVLAPYELLRLRRAAQQGTLTLQPIPTYLYPDTHAVLRHTILRSAERVALTIGACLYYLAAALPGLLLYLMLAAAAHYYTLRRPEHRAFGWAACGLFALLDAVPRFLTGLLGWLAAWFVPGTTPFTALTRLPRAGQHFHGWVAYLTDTALGGPMPSPAGEIALPWVGTGPARTLPAHFTRALQWAGLTLVLWILLLSATAFIYHT